MGGTATALGWIPEPLTHMTDTYLLFSELPYDFHTDCPLPVGNGVWLASADDSQRIIRQAEDADGLRAMLIPEQVIGLGQVHVCLHRTHSTTQTIRHATRDLWHAMLSLRLALPFPFRTSGTLTFDGNRVSEFGRSEMRSAVNPPQISQFCGATVARAARINRRIGQLRGQGLERVQSALTLFSQISLGSVCSWQMAMLGLFGTLECIFPQPRPGTKGLAHPGESYGHRLARRVSAFLPTELRPRKLRQSINSEYRNTRNPLAHGFHIVPVRNVSTTKRNSARVLKLHETARLTILGVLGTDNATLRALLPEDAQGVDTQIQLDDIGTAPATFLDGQRFWPAT